MSDGQPYVDRQGRGGPLTFKCVKCRRPYRSEPTGRARYGRTSFGAAWKFEYRCRCGNVGWTMHHEIATAAVERGNLIIVGRSAAPTEGGQ